MANRVYDALASVKASEELKSSTLQYLEEERERRNRRPGVFFGLAVSMKSFSAAVCLALLVTAGTVGYSVVRTPVSYISIDVNPSIELALNRLDRVVSAAAYNEDGEIVLDRISVKGKPYVEAIDTIVESDAMSGYLTQDAVLTFTVASQVDKKEQSLQAGVEQSHGCKGHGGQSVNVDASLVTEAHGHGVSFGKYAAYLELAQYDGNVTVEDCRSMSMSEINQQIDAHEHGCAAREDQVNGSGPANMEDTGADAGTAPEETAKGRGCAVHGDRSDEPENDRGSTSGNHHGRGWHQS